MEELFAPGLTALGLPPESAPDLARYGEMLREKNRVMNLTAIEDPAEIAALHFLDSAALLTLADFRNKRVAVWAPAQAFRGFPCGFWSPPSA